MGLHDSRWSGSGGSHFWRFQTSCQSNLPSFIGESIVFARWCQCASLSETWFLGLREPALRTASQSVQPFMQGSLVYSGCRGPVNGHVSALLLKCRAMPTRWTVRFTWRTTWCWICSASRKLTPSTCWNDRSSSFRTTPPSLHSSTVCSCSCLHIFITFYILGSFILFVSRSL